MGAFLDFAVSDTITDEEWEEAFDEVSSLIRKFPTEIDIHTFFKNQTMRAELWKEENWDEDGTHYWYIKCTHSETFYLSNKLEKHSSEYYDPLLCWCHGIEDNSRAKNHLIRHWSSKVGSIEFSTYLLTIPCLLSALLPNKVSFDGDYDEIFFCKEACKLIKELTNRTIPLPEQCDINAVYTRLCQFPFKTDEDFLEDLMRIWKGKCNEFAPFVKEHFSKSAITNFCNKEFWISNEFMQGKNTYLYDFFKYGFQIQDLYSIIPVREIAKNRGEDITSAAMKFTELAIVEIDYHHFPLVPALTQLTELFGDLFDVESLCMDYICNHRVSRTIDYLNWKEKQESEDK